MEEGVHRITSRPATALGKAEAPAVLQFFPPDSALHVCCHQVASTPPRTPPDSALPEAAEEFYTTLINQEIEGEGETLNASVLHE